MIPCSHIIRRSLTTEKFSINSVFFQDRIQKLLKDITRFEESKIFGRRVFKKLRSPKFVFMTDAQLQRAKEDAYHNAKALLQMPPVMEANTESPSVLARDEELVGYTKFKIMFVDITPGHTDRTRLMSVREPDGTLRYPTHEERSRLNHMFYPIESRSIDPPKMFEEKHLLDLLKRRQYVYALNRACIQFEPDDPRYVDLTSKIYNYIDDKQDYDELRSTRHFGPMSLYLAYNKRADNLMLEMLSKGFIEDAAKLVKIYNTCHRIDYDDGDDDLTLLKNYAKSNTAKSHNIELALQRLIGNKPNKE